VAEQNKDESFFYGKLLNNAVAKQNKDESFFMVNC
jgi:hypothetical protein